MSPNIIDHKRGSSRQGISSSVDQCKLNCGQVFEDNKVILKEAFLELD